MTPTPSQTAGPFFGFGLPPVDGGGEVRVEGQVLDGKGDPVGDALIEATHDDFFARCRTDEEGAFRFTAPEAPFFNVTVFARGLLRHLQTRLYLPGHEHEVPAEVPPERRRTLIAARDGEVYRFDIRLQGTDETVFFL
ncbi:MAG TPA: protocatechuate 3,4-dioxygenase subunit alpha [Candidatus Dormibacteraeota bacterium]|nr:protocatechuate 3,4-dioxygenase subunit alpha [Candidatus Dormibacteraeota bacterium]